MTQKIVGWLNSHPERKGIMKLILKEVETETAGKIQDELLKSAVNLTCTIWKGKSFDTNLVEIEVEKENISFSTYRRHGVTTFEFIEYDMDESELGTGKAVLFEIACFLYESYEVK